MDRRFMALRVTATIFKVLAWLVLILGLLGAVSVLVAGLLFRSQPALLGLDISGPLAGISAFVVVLILSILNFLLLYAGGEFTTRPIRFKGKELVINYATSAVGSVRVEIRGEDGKPLPGFNLRSCPQIFGDELEHIVSWKGGSDVSQLEGKPIRLRFVMKDADLYSVRFRP